MESLTFCYIWRLINDGLESDNPMVVEHTKSLMEPREDESTTTDDLALINDNLPLEDVTGRFLDLLKGNRCYRCENDYFIVSSIGGEDVLLSWNLN